MNTRRRYARRRRAYALNLDSYEWFGHPPKAVYKSDIDYHYGLCRSEDDILDFDFHSDYWDYAECYQADNLEAFDLFEPYIGQEVEVDGLTGTLIGIAIDRKYNSLSHTLLVLE